MFHRGSVQVNDPFGSDAELISIGDQRIGITTDLLSEELSLGLFVDPVVIGWVSVAMSLSDLAAAGCTPSGVLLQATIPESASEQWVRSMLGGVESCCRAHGTSVIGGDTNIGELRLSTTAIGPCRTANPNPRHRLQPGDLLYVSGHSGVGNALAHANVSGSTYASQLSDRFRPTIAFEVARTALEVQGACIDVSDGLIPTLATWLDVQNGSVGAAIDHLPLSHISMYAQQAGLPAVAFLLGGVGDYSILCGIPHSAAAAFEKEHRNSLNDGTLMCIGSVTDRPMITVTTDHQYAWPIELVTSVTDTRTGVQEGIQQVLELLDPTHRTT